MRVRSMLTLGVALVFGTLAFAQGDHKIEIRGDYSYVHANPQNNNIIPTFSLNGGGGSAAFYFSKYIGIEAEVEGYGSYTHNFTINNTTYCPDGPCAVSASGNLFTYNVGPVVKFRTSHSSHLERLYSAERTRTFTETFMRTAVAASSPANRPATMALISCSAEASTCLWANTSP
jgi:hypothetical protein